MTTDAGIGERGARHRVIAAGREVLTADLLGRLHRVSRAAAARGEHPPSDEAAVVLVADGPILLMGYSPATRDGPIWVPEEGGDPGADVARSSTGSEGEGHGGGWVVPLGAPRWHDRANGEPVEPPGPAEGTGLDAFAAPPTDVVGVGAAVRLDPDSLARPEVGRWFPARGGGPLPAALGGGAWWAATVRGGPAVHPTRPLWMVVSGGAGTVLRAAIDGAIDVDMGLPSREGPELPRHLLTGWLARAHPRLDEAGRRERLSLVRRWALRPPLSPPTSRGARATWAHFVQDWQATRWAREETLPHRLALGGLGERAIEAVLAGVAAADVPVVVRAGTEGARLAAWRARLGSRLHLVVAAGPPPEDGWWLLHTAPDGPQLVLDRDRVLLLDTTTDAMLGAPPPDWLPPASVAVLDTAGAAARAGPSLRLSASSSEAAWVWEGCRRWPGGDEAWANATEAVSPLAAWIATPDAHRWPRWQRLQHRLDQHWIDLLAPADVPPEATPGLAAGAPTDWAQRAARELAARLPSGPDLQAAARSWLDSDRPVAAWGAAQLLAAGAPVDLILRSRLTDEAADLLAAHPQALSPRALGQLDQLLGRSARGGPIWRSLAQACAQHPLLRGWSALWFHRCDGGALEVLDLATLPALPTDWWASSALDLLAVALADGMASQLVASTAISWPAVLLRPPGELDALPGAVHVAHPGPTLDLVTSIDRWQGGEHGPEGPGATSLEDVRRALIHADAPGRPPAGRTHPDVGWLLRPVEDWPRFDDSVLQIGDTAVAVRLLARRSAWHPDLRVQHQRLLDVGGRETD